MLERALADLLGDVLSAACLNRRDMITPLADHLDGELGAWGKVALIDSLAELISTDLLLRLWSRWVEADVGELARKACHAEEALEVFVITHRIVEGSEGAPPHHAHRRVAPHVTPPREHDVRPICIPRDRHSLEGNAIDAERHHPQRVCLMSCALELVEISAHHVEGAVHLVDRADPHSIRACLDLERALNVTTAPCYD